MADHLGVPDATVRAEGLLNYHWIFLLNTPGAKEEIGLKYLSHGHGACPHWSLWFADVRGVYRLELRGAMAVPGYDWLAEIKVKYYPRPEEACFAGLSIYEQACRMGGTFRTRPAGAAGEGGCACHSGQRFARGESRFADLANGTGAPSGRYQELIPDDFFYAGVLLLAFREGSGTRARWDSLDCWRVRLTRDCTIAGKAGRPPVLRRKGEIDRDYPGFFLTDRVCRRVLDGWSRLHGYEARDETRHEEVGMEFLSDGRELVPARAPDIRRIVVDVGCRRAGIAALPDLPAVESEALH